MKYKDLIKFEPITSVVKLVESEQTAKAQELVKSYVFSTKIKEDLQAVILRNLKSDADYETKGIQIVGSYGTGKSHLMSLVSAIADNADLLALLPDTSLQEVFSSIAGRYKVLRFEVGTDRPLKDIMFAQLERFLHKNGVTYTFDDTSKFSWKEQISGMMAEFEAVFPDKHLLVVVDELLEYLKGRKPYELHNDLMLLRQLGEASDQSRFRLMFGVQELLYRSPEFQFQADMLLKIQDRYDDLIITREDVSFVVKERLLRKSEHQKGQVREHLLQFAHLYEGVNTRLNEFTDLFPVHPAYIQHFEQIKHGKSQREILKVLSARFEKLMNEAVPTDSPGLITYDSYWPELAQDPSMLTVPDIRAVRDKSDIIADKISQHFTGARANRRDMATRIANALAVRILCDDLDKRNGATVESLKEDLCPTVSGVSDPDTLLKLVETTALQLITATAGQYVDRDTTSSEFFIRTEGGINIQQLVREYADDVLKREPERADEYFYDFLQEAFEFKQNPYRSGFKIWQHSLTWTDTKSFRLGYVFFGNPNERSTTEPIQQYYLFYGPLFTDIVRNDGPDEIYIDLSGLSAEFRDVICLYGAARAKEGNASSQQKSLFQSQVKEYVQRALTLFNSEFVNHTQVIHTGTSSPLKSFSLPGDGATPRMMVDSVAARLLNPFFTDKFPDYPAFKDLLQPLAKENFEGRVAAALKKIVKPDAPNRDGEAILSGLGLWNGQRIDRQHSRYADALLDRLTAKGSGKVLNRDEILSLYYVPDNLYYAADYQLDYQLEFLVLAALAQNGDIELVWSAQKTLTAANVDMLLSLTPTDYFTFQYVKEPQGIPFQALKALFRQLNLPDLTPELEKPDTISRIVTQAKLMVQRVVKAKTMVAQGLKCRNVSLLTDAGATAIKTELDTLSTMLDAVQGYNTYGKLKNFRFSETELNATFAAYAYCDRVETLEARAKKFETLVGYLYTAQGYVPETELPLYQQMSDAIGMLGTSLAGNDAQLKQYEARLTALIDQYAQYYIGQYIKFRLSTADGHARDRIMQSEQKRTCDVLADIEFVGKKEYDDWRTQLTNLRVADTAVTKALVKQEPFHDFNPREYVGKAPVNVRDLEDQLAQMVAQWTKTLSGVLKDPSVQDNLDLLSTADQQWAVSFRDGQINIDSTNAPRLRDLVRTLSQSMDKVEVSLADLRQRFDKPLSPGEAIDTLTNYINDLCVGKERSKVRILIK